MLKHLSITNYALIDYLEVDFDDRLNVITGETGSGKSILLGAMALMLGGKSDVDALRDSSRNCVVEGVFDISRYGLSELFESLDLEYDHQTIIRRVVMPSGKSRAYVNDMPVSLATLKLLSSRFIDIHSQHQTMLLTQSRFQIDMLDGMCAHAELLEKYRDSYSLWRAKQKQLQDAKAKAQDALKQREYIEFQLEKLLEAKLYDSEQDELEARQNELLHASQIQESMIVGADIIGGRETNIIAQLKDIIHSLSGVAGVYAPASQMHERLSELNVELKDIYNDMESLGSSVEADPRLLDITQQRLDTIYGLESRYGVESVGELITLRDELQSKLDMIDGYDEQFSELESEIAELGEKVVALATKISAARAKATIKIEKYVGDTLSYLGMADAVLGVEMSSVEPNIDGVDAVRFMFTANKGGSKQPIEKVASGGEMSRLMLTLKALFAKNTNLPTIIFDEIDTGVSGNIASKMGEMIVALSSNIQIINITHLPQVASKGDTHFVVSKKVVDSTTISNISKLSSEQRVEEIAKMLSGSDVTQAALTQAKHLLGVC